MIKKNFNFFYFPLFFNLSILAYIKIDYFNILYLNLNTKILLIYKFLISLICLFYFYYLFRKKKYSFSIQNFDFLDIFLLFFISLYSLNYLFTFFDNGSFFNLKQIYILIILFSTFWIFRFYNFAFEPLKKKLILFSLLGFSFIFLILYFVFDSTDIFSTSTNAISLIFFLLFIFSIESEKNLNIKLLYTILFLLLFYLLETKFFILFTVISFIFSFEKTRIFSPKKLFLIFVILYLSLNFIFPNFIIKEFPILKTKKIDLIGYSQNIELVNRFYMCTQIIDEYDKNSLLENIYNKKEIDYCLSINQKEKLLPFLVKYRNIFEKFSLVYSFGKRVEHKVEVFIFSLNNNFMPSLFEYREILKVNNSTPLITQSTPHDSFALILIRLGIIGLILIFYFFYKIISFKGSNHSIFFKYNLIIILGYYSLNDQLFFHNFLSSLFFWFFCSQIVYKENKSYV